MQNILVGISLSEQSPTVLRFALRLAQYFDGELTVAYIVQDAHLDELNYDKRKDDREEAIEVFKLEKEKRLIDFISKQHSKQYQNSINTIVEYGDPYEQLRTIAQEQNMDLMLVGKLAKPGTVFFEDIANQLIEWSPCPVFIVPKDVEFQAFQRIVYASDLMLEDCAAILRLKKWLEIFDAELICLHIYQKEGNKKEAQNKLSILRQLFPQENIRFRMLEADTEKGIESYSALTQSNLIVTTHRARTFWEGFFKKSITKAIAGKVSVPMLVFQQK